MFIVDFFKTNPMALAILGGGTSTAIVAYLLNTVKWIPNTIVAAVMSHITAKIQITESLNFFGDSDTDKIRELESFIRTFNHRVINNSHNLDSSDAYVKLPAGVYYIFKTLLKDKIILTISVDVLENKAQGYKPFVQRYTLRGIGITSHREKFINKLFERLEQRKVKASLATLSNKMLMAEHVAGGGWPFIIDTNKRDLSSIYMDDSIKQNIISHIDNFKNNRHVYDKYKIPYKTGIILYGEPGTGKTSLVKALASHINGVMINVDINTDTHKVRELIADIRRFDCNNKSCATYKDWEEYVNFETSPVVVVFEEIDKRFSSTNKKNKKGKEVKEEPNDSKNVLVTSESEQESESDKIAGAIATGFDNAVLDDMLQFLDGMKSPDNVIFIATTNYLDRLDPALIRPGRFDLCLEMKRLNSEKAFEMINEMVPGRSVMEYQEFFKEDGTINSSELFAKLISDKIKEEVFNKNGDINERS